MALHHINIDKFLDSSILFHYQVRLQQHPSILSYVCCSVGIEAASFIIKHLSKHSSSYHPDWAAIFTDRNSCKSSAKESRQRGGFRARAKMIAFFLKSFNVLFPISFPRQHLALTDPRPLP
jgi:hypothetical protein